MRPLRFGLVGTGHWALSTHGSALASSPDASLVGAWGRDPARTSDLARRLGTKAYTDYDQLLADVDAVAMAVPPDVQAPLAVRAARAGRHLLLEKPLALSEPDARAVVDAVEASGVACLVFFTQRFLPEMEQWLEAVGEQGPFYSAHLVQYTNIYYPGSPYSGSHWRRERGALWDIGPHALATVLPLLGPVGSVDARRGPSGTDTVHLLLAHVPGAVWRGTTPGATTVREDPDLRLGDQQGPVSTISLSLTMPEASVANKFVVYGAKGARTRPETNFEAVDALRRAVRELGVLVGTGERHHRCDARTALEVVRILAAAERAAR